jgi:hypothetical protein
MPGLVLGAVGTFALSLILARTFLRMRCRGIGPPFGPRARYWALFIVVGTAAVSTAFGLLVVAVSGGHSAAALAGIIVPPGLQLSKLPPQRDRDMLPRTMAHVLTLPFSRLYDRMGDDMQDWCDTRIAAARPNPRWISDAVQYYWNQMGRVTDQRARGNLDRWRESIVHQIDIVRLIDLDASPARLRASLQLHPSTQHIRKYRDDDLPRLARRLESDALNELNLFLAYAYRLGYHKMLIYPFRPGAHRPGAPPAQARPAEPLSPKPHNP